MWPINEHGMTEFSIPDIEGMSRNTMGVMGVKNMMYTHRYYWVKFDREAREFINVTHDQFLKLLADVNPWGKYGFHKSGMDIYFSA